MSLSPDMENGFQLEAAGIQGQKSTAAAREKTRRRVSPPSPNSRKLVQNDHGDDEHFDRDADRQSNSSRIRLDRAGSSTGMFAEKQQHRRPRASSRSAYGWLKQNSGYIFLLVVFFAFLRAGLHAAAPPSVSPSKSAPSASTAASFAAKAKAWLAGPGAPHPIPGLMDAADARFRAKVARQSPTLAAAVAEYRRRYGRAPPAGFDRWYAFARSRNFVMVDEFDAVVEDLAPFWDLSGEEVRDRAALVGALPSIDVVRVQGGKATTVRGGNGKFVDSEVSARAAGFRAMLGKFVKQLPDMDFPINAKAEGRVVVPWEHVAYPNLTQPASTLLNRTTFRADWAGSGSVWDAWRRTCPPSSPARRLYSAVGAGWAGVGGGRDRVGEGYRAAVEAKYHAGPSSAFGFFKKSAGGEEENKEKDEDAPSGHAGVGTGAEFVFARDTSAGLDFCAAPGAHYEQGHFFSDWRVLPALVPVFSPARAKGFGDIRVPSHYYYGGTKRYTYAWDPVNLEQRAADPMEVPWEAKRDVVWWRGASTGGGSSPNGFGHGYQRHRFLRMSSVGLVSGTLADAQRTTAVTFALPVLGEEEGLAAGGVQEPFTYPATDGGPSAAFTTVPVPLAALNADVMDAAFTKAVVPVGPEHRFGDSTELGEAWGYKYLLDLDGMGYSGRFMAFLASDSVPVKATVYDEFFSGWIEPWLHYIPLSPAYTEIYNVVSYFSGPPPSALRAAGLGAAPSAFRGSKVRPVRREENTSAPADEEKSGAGPQGARQQGIGKAEGTVAPGAGAGAVKRPLGQVERRAEGTRGGEQQQQQQPALLRSAAQVEGDRRLRRIARAGKQWKETMGRTVDMEIYVYRLALEYARLWADDREAMSYK
ncbi:glycosyltransferase family 90 protein [Mycena polygramma]|nr:glycosyltransferase family 90 protein [Mycena polygramma]